MAHTLKTNVVAKGALGLAEHVCAAGDWAVPSDFFDIDDWEDHVRGLPTEWDV